MEPVAILKHALVEHFNRAMMFLFDSDMETAEGMRYRENELVLEPGDCLYLYTDGVTEATNSREELFGEGRLQEVLNETPGLPVAELLSRVKASIDAFVGDAEQVDDITMLALRCQSRGSGLEN